MTALSPSSLILKSRSNAVSVSRFTPAGRNQKTEQVGRPPKSRFLCLSADYQPVTVHISANRACQVPCFFMGLDMGVFPQSSVNQSVIEITACQLVQFKVLPSTVSELESGLFGAAYLAKTKNYYICERKRCFEKLAYSLEIFQEISKPYGAGYV